MFSNENPLNDRTPDLLRGLTRRDFLARSGQGAALLAAAGSLAAVLEACGVSSGSSTSSSVNTSGLPPVPKVPNAPKLSGKLVISGAGAGLGGQVDRLMGAQFQKDTGVQVSFIAPPASTSDLYAQYQRLLTSKSKTPDVLNVDVVYPGAYAQFLTPLDSLPGMMEQAQLHYPNIIKNNTVNGKLVGMPIAGDFGILFYRKDLVQKYGFSGPPATWQELTDQATKIQAGEKASNPSFSGFVFQGNAYEGLTCDALEWVASYGGGNFISNGADNPQAVAALKLAQSWIGKVSPTGVTSFQEEDSRGAFDAGNAAFMRNWPYAYSISKDPKNSKVTDNFDVAPLPHGPGGETVSAVGGWQLAINGASENVQAAAAYIKYSTGAEMQKYRAINASNVPSMPKVAADPDVLKVEPFLSVQTTRVTRPSSLGTKYNQGSTFIFQGVNQILRGQDVPNTLKQLQTQLQSL